MDEVGDRREGFQSGVIGNYFRLVNNRNKNGSSVAAGKGNEIGELGYAGRDPKEKGEGELRMDCRLQLPS